MQVKRDVTLAVVTEPMFTLETPPPSWYKQSNESERTPPDRVLVRDLSYSRFPVTAGFFYDSLSFCDESELQRRELTIWSSLSLRIRTAAYVNVIGIYHLVVLLKRYMGIKYFTRSDQGMCSDPSITPYNFSCSLIEDWTDWQILVKLLNTYLLNFISATKLECSNP